MQPTLAELLANLPDEPSGAPTSAHGELEALIAELGSRPVPTGRLRRLWSMGTLGTGLVAAYVAWWVRGGFQDQDERARALSETHLSAALALFSRMGYLRGAVMKLGQVLANSPDVVPSEFASLLGRLHFEAPPMHFALLREHVRGELGGDPLELFDDFETEAVAAASLGQVHRARLKGSGRPVAVKIQYPGIGRTIRDDARNLALLSGGLRFTRDWQHVQRMLEEIHRMLEQETDYEREAAMQELARGAFGADDGVVVPRVWPELSSRQVLTMDWIEGRHLRAFLAGGPSRAERDRAGELVRLSSLRLWYRARLVYADPHPGNFLFLPDGRLGLIDFGCCHRFTDEEFDYVAQSERAIHGTQEEIELLIARSVDASDPAELDPRHLELLREWCEWVWLPLRVTGPFDFGDRAHFGRGVEILRALLRARFLRSKPVNLWFEKVFFGERAMLTHLEARVPYGDLMRRETTVVPEAR